MALRVRKMAKEDFMRKHCKAVANTDSSVMKKCGGEVHGAIVALLNLVEEVVNRELQTVTLLHDGFSNATTAAPSSQVLPSLRWHPSLRLRAKLLTAPYITK